jgi:hypothetical protein
MMQFPWRVFSRTQQTVLERGEAQEAAQLCDQARPSHHMLRTALVT